MARVNARSQGSVDVALVREFLHSEEFLSLPMGYINDFHPAGPDEWKEHQEIIDILQNDPAFDKSTR
jgi:hypothetical protein